MEFTVPIVRSELSQTESNYLAECITVQRPPGIDLDRLMKNSMSFPRKFPISTMRCSSLIEYNYVDKEVLEDNANSCYPLLHENALLLYIHFLEHKKRYGNAIENKVYANMGLLDLVQRLLEKRAVCFFGKVDSYLLMSGYSDIDGRDRWEHVGTEEERDPLYLHDCLSYDEMKLSALLSISSPSYFINDGKRDNKGIPNEDAQSFTTYGIIISLIGARLRRCEYMEWQDILVTKHQNTAKNGYGPPPKIGCLKRKYRMTLHFLRQLWANFYGIQPNLPLYEEVAKLHKACREDALSQYVEVFKHTLFDNMIFKKRLSVSIETLLIEAESRAAALKKKAYIHMIGIGLGVWRLSSHQNLVFLEVFADCLRRLRPILQHISDIDFSWFQENFQKSMWEDIMTSDDKGPSINITYSWRSPYEKLSGKDADKLLVVSYAGDGNSLPGNEFWMESLNSSSDCATACSTQVTELHNPHINKGKVSGANLHIASRDWGVLPVSDYIKRKWPQLNSTDGTSFSAKQARADGSASS